MTMFLSCTLLVNQGFYSVSVANRHKHLSLERGWQYTSITFTISGAFSESGEIFSSVCFKILFEPDSIKHSSNLKRRYWWWCHRSVTEIPLSQCLCRNLHVILSSFVCAEWRVDLCSWVFGKFVMYFVLELSFYSLTYSTNSHSIS